MTGYHIQPLGVQHVLNQTQTQAQEFEGQLKNLRSALRGAASESHSSIVAAALEELANAMEPQMRFVFTRTGASMNAAVRATNAYLRGDHEMVRHAQAAAAKAPEPAPLLPGSRSPIPPGASAGRAK